MNPNLARSMEIIEFVCTHFAKSAAGLVAWAMEDEDAGTQTARHLECAAEHLDEAAADLQMAREGDGADRENP